MVVDWVGAWVGVKQSVRVDCAPLQGKTFSIVYNDYMLPVSQLPLECLVGSWPIIIYDSTRIERFPPPMSYVIPLMQPVSYNAPNPC